MIKLKKLLYATDLSKNSAYAFRYAVDVAERQNGEIIILHVIEPIPQAARHYAMLHVGEEKWEDRIKHEQEKSIERIRQRLEKFCERESKVSAACMALVSKMLVRPGYPVDEILKAADEEQCDAIVLGTHGKGFLKQTFLGSVARTVLDRTQRPVFIIPLPHGETDISFEDI
jgi:nucleotide-binding universal stress UspA family protein